MRSVFAALFALTLSSGALAQDGEAALGEIIAAFEAIEREADPITAGGDGDRAALRRLPDVSPEAIGARTARYEALIAQLGGVDASALAHESALNHALLIHIMTQRVEEAGYDLARIAFENDSGFHTLGDYLARTTTIATRDDAEAWIARLEALPGYYDQNLANLRRGVQTGLTQPRIVIERVIAVARAHAAQQAESHTLMLPFAQAPATMPAADFAAYRARALAIVEGRILPKQRAFAQFLERTYLPAARPEIAWRTTPNGEATYRYLVRRETTTQMSPDEIHQLGLQEVARIRGLMDEAIRASGFTGTFPEFLAFLRSDAQFYARSPQELLSYASEISKRADDRLPRLFGVLPRLPYGVRPVPDDIAEGYTSARYWPGSMPLGIAGGYMVNTARLDQRPLYEFPALSLHEAVPGHHLQIALAQELSGLPYFRRNLGPTAFVEGWGLYAEYLGEEMGIYRTPYELFGRYSMEMWRACRLVADTGIHWMGWDIERARACFSENSALAPHNIQTELERYISWPGQALAYKIGELRFRRLREQAQDALGERFDVRAFHDVLLGGGALPLDVVEMRVRGWIEGRQTPTRPARP